MNNSISLFKKAYEEGLNNNKINFDSWLKNYGLNSILLDKFVTSNDNPEYFFNRNKEIEKIAQFIGIQERTKKFSFVNIVGSKGSGKTVMLQMIHDSYKGLNPESEIKYVNAEKFSESFDDDKENEFYFEKLLTELENTKILIIDDCDKDIRRMFDNIKELSVYPLTLIMAWRPLHWNKFKIEYHKFNLDNPILINPFNKDSSITFLKNRYLSFKKKKKDISPFTDESLLLISELSQGSPLVILKMSYSLIKRAYQFDKKKVDIADVKAVFLEEGYEDVNEFLEKCTPITKNILKILTLKSNTKGVSIDELSEEVDLDRTSVFYHLQKMRNKSLLDEYYLKKTVMFSIKDKFAPLIDQYLWNNRIT